MVKSGGAFAPLGDFFRCFYGRLPFAFCTLVLVLDHFEMKNFFFIFLLIPCVAFSATTNYDKYYFAPVYQDALDAAEAAASAYGNSVPDRTVNCTPTTQYGGPTASGGLYYFSVLVNIYSEQISGPGCWGGDIDAHRFWADTSCPAGTEPDPVTSECITPPDPCEQTALQGDTWDSVSESCQCPSGTVPLLDMINGYNCQVPVEPCSPSHPDWKGDMNGYPVCDSGWDDECPAGYSGGYAFGQWGCYADGNCAPGETYINGVCIGPDDTNSDPNPDSDPTPDDTDNDGIPDSEDPDDDNDGIPDATDDTPEGEGPIRTGRSSSDCNVPPRCDGDPIDCAVLHQEWINYCSGHETLQSLSTLADDAASTLAGQGMSDLDSMTPGELFDDLGGTETDVSTEYGDFLAAPGNSAACPAPISINLGPFGSPSLEFTIFCDLADLLRYIVLLGAYFFGGQIVLRSLTA